MSLFIKPREFAPAPAGLHNAVCCEVEDIGLQQTPNGVRQKVRFIWELAEIDPDSGERFTVRRNYTQSLDRRSGLVEMLSLWMPPKRSIEELKSFDWMSLLGQPCMLHVVHAVKDEGRVWANMHTIMPLPAGTEALTVKDYVRSDGGGKSPSLPTAPIATSGPLAKGF